MTSEAHAILTRFERGLVSREELALASALDCGLERSAGTARIQSRADLEDHLRQAGPRCAVAAALGAARRVVGILEGAFAPEAARDSLALVESWTATRNAPSEPAALAHAKKVRSAFLFQHPNPPVADPRENASLALFNCAAAIASPKLLFHSIEGSISWASLALGDSTALFEAMRAEILRALATSR